MRLEISASNVHDEWKTGRPEAEGTVATLQTDNKAEGTSGSNKERIQVLHWGEGNLVPNTSFPKSV